MNPAVLSAAPVNVANRLTAMAKVMPSAIAIAEPLRRAPVGKSAYRTITFEELERDTNKLARGLKNLGVVQGTRLALLVRPSIDFVAAVFALLKSGAVIILIDPGMGRKNMIGCLEEARPEGFVAIPAAQAARIFYRKKFPRSRLNVTVGSRWFWGGPTFSDFRRDAGAKFPTAPTAADDPAAIIFTTGSTGPPKGVLYRHKTFDHQVTEIRDFYRIQPGEVDLPCFPLFGLFNAAMGVTTVLPDMDPTRPAKVDPKRVIQAIDDWQITQSFGSPAVWNRVGRYCTEHNVRLASLRRVLSAGAPVPPATLQMMKDHIHPNGDVHTPYGATESLPVASIAATQVLGETAAQTAVGAGFCVGSNFAGIRWKIIEAVDGPISQLADTRELAPREIGELIVQGPVVTDRYVTRTEANALAKIRDGNDFWHRMGDLGYLDQQGRFWFCGRLAHRVLTADGPMYTIPCEAIFNQHSDVFRTALVGVGRQPNQVPVIIVEPKADKLPRTVQQRTKLIAELRDRAASSPLTSKIGHFLIHPDFPVDIRHNAKIVREKLAVWAASQLDNKLDKH